MFFKHKNSFIYAVAAFSSSCLIAFFIVFSLFYYSDIDLKKDEIYIQKGDSLSDVIISLDLDKGSKFKLKFVMRFLSLYDDVKPGKHSFEDVISIGDFVENITSSPRTEITILEGWSLKDIGNYLDTNNDLYSIDIDNFNQLCKNRNFINKNLKAIDTQNILTLEGYLYPETYKVDPYINETDLIKVFIAEFLNKTKSYNQRINNKVMIVASLIEAETDLISEMDTISSVYNNRITGIPNKMKLQADPTVLFYMPDDSLAMFKDRSSLKAKRLSATVWKKYKNMDNPYNTYKYLMPPGPINSPRIEAIEAALKPADTNYLYMVMRSSLGRHLFSEDFETHDKRVKGN